MTSEARLEAVLRLWRDTWSPRLADLAGRIEVPVASLNDELPEAQAACAAYLEERAHDSTDLDRSAVLDATRVFATNALPSNVVPALTCWLEVQPDPRVAAFAFDLLTRRGALREVTHAVAEALLEVLRVHGDAGLIPRLESWSKSGAHRAWLPKVRRTVRALEKRVALPVPEARFAELAGGPTRAAPRGPNPTDGAALLDAIHASPDDDAARLAWADWLTEAGDPLGEFIVLQINRSRGRVPAAANKRERALLSQLRTRLLGPLMPCVSLSSLEFRRGFLSHLEFNWNEPPPARALELVESFSQGRSPRLPKVQWRALRRAHGVHPTDAAELVARAPALEELAVGLAEWSLLDGLLTSARPRGLRVLRLAVELPAASRWPALLASKVFVGLERLELRMLGKQWTTGDGKKSPLPLLPGSALAALSRSVAEVLVQLIAPKVTVRYLRQGERFSVVRLELDAEAELSRAAQVANGVLRGLKETPLDLLEVIAPKPPSAAKFEQLIAATRTATKALRCSSGK